MPLPLHWVKTECSRTDVRGGENGVTRRRRSRQCGSGEVRSPAGLERAEREPEAVGWSERGAREREASLRGTSAHLPGAATAASGDDILPGRETPPRPPHSVSQGPLA